MSRRHLSGAAVAALALFLIFSVAPVSAEDLAGAPRPATAAEPDGEADPLVEPEPAPADDPAGGAAPVVEPGGEPATESPAAPVPDTAVPDPVAPPADEVEQEQAVVDEELDGARRPYPGSPQDEAALVADEDYRLSEVRTMGSISGFTGNRLINPYRLVTGSSYTLVLTERRTAYTLTDLLTLAPQTFVRQADGSYMLSEHIVVQEGATLQLNAPGKLEVRLASDPDGFVSIVSYGGRIEVTGTQGIPVTITSWDRQLGVPDTTTRDGRAYIRAIGGQVGLKDVRINHLGFWSGRTGGLALTGTDRPNPGALDGLGKTLTVQDQKDRADQRDAGVATDDTTGGVTLDQALPTGDLPLPQYDIDQPQYSYVSASIVDTFVDGNAFGAFIAGASGVDIRGGGFDNSLVDGLTLHRFVTNAVIEGTRAGGNGGDGIVLARATTGTVLSEVDASGNARNGISLSGLPLATGPTATGTSIGDYGNNAVSNSRAAGNGRYGIEVVGGHDVGVNANDLDGNDMAIVVRGGARAVAVVGNNVDAPRRHGIAIRDGVTDSTVSGNIVTGGETAIHVRASAVDVVRNTLTGASVHGVSLVGDVTGTVLDQNTISGQGPSALDLTRAEGVDARDFDNETSGWSDTTPWLVTLKRIFQPLNLLWTILALVVVVTAVRGVRRRATTGHPYADRQPLHRPEDVVREVPPTAGDRPAERVPAGVR